MKKQFQITLFVIAIGYIFIELQRALSGSIVSCKEWIGFAIFVGAAIFLWFLGKRIDKEEMEKRKEEWRQEAKKVIQEVLKEAGVLKNNKDK